MAVFWNGSKCSHTTCMLRFFTVPRLALTPNLISEIGSKVVSINMFRWKWNHPVVETECYSKRGYTTNFLPISLAFSRMSAC